MAAADHPADVFPGLRSHCGHRWSRQLSHEDNNNYYYFSTAEQDRGTGRTATNCSILSTEIIMKDMQLLRSRENLVTRHTIWWAKGKVGVAARTHLLQRRHVCSSYFIVLTGYRKVHNTLHDDQRRSGLKTLRNFAVCQPTHLVTRPARAVRPRHVGRCSRSLSNN